MIAGNVRRVFYGDMMFAYAMCDVREGQELTHAYVDVLYDGTNYTSYAKRTLDMRIYNCTCNCRLCELDRADTEGELLRRKLLARLGEIEAKLG